MTHQEIIDHLESRGFSKHPSHHQLGYWMILVVNTRFKLTNDNPNFEVIGRADDLEFLDKLLLDLGVYT